MSTRRDRKITIAPEYHLIVTEGEKTEPNYFRGLRNEINKYYKNRIEIEINGVGQGANTLTLLDKAQEYVARSSNKYTHIWLVYDKDDFPKDDFDNTYFKCQSLTNENEGIFYHALWSNECIEYWFLIHFAPLDSTLIREEYYPRLSKFLKSKYTKNKADMYDLLKPYIKTAIANAKRTAENNKGLPPSQCEPGTAVYEIFELLGDYISSK